MVVVRHQADQADQAARLESVPDFLVASVDSAVLSEQLITLVVAQARLDQMERVLMVASRELLHSAVVVVAVMAEAPLARHHYRRLEVPAATIL